MGSVYCMAVYIARAIKVVIEVAIDDLDIDILLLK